MCKCEKIVQELMERDELDYETAVEYFLYNYADCDCGFLYDCPDDQTEADLTNV